MLVSLAASVVVAALAVASILVSEVIAAVLLPLVAFAVGLLLLRWLRRQPGASGPGS